MSWIVGQKINNQIYFTAEFEPSQKGKIEFRQYSGKEGKIITTIAARAMPNNWLGKALAFLITFFNRKFKVIYLGSDQLPCIVKSQQVAKKLFLKESESSKVSTEFINARLTEIAKINDITSSLKNRNARKFTYLPKEIEEIIDQNSSLNNQVRNITFYYKLDSDQEKPVIYKTLPDEEGTYLRVNCGACRGINEFYLYLLPDANRVYEVHKYMHKGKEKYDYTCPELSYEQLKDNQECLIFMLDQHEIRSSYDQTIAERDKKHPQFKNTSEIFYNLPKKFNAFIKKTGMHFHPVNHPSNTRTVNDTEMAYVYDHQGKIIDIYPYREDADTPVPDPDEMDNVGYYSIVNTKSIDPNEKLGDGKIHEAVVLFKPSGEIKQVLTPEQYANGLYDKTDLDTTFAVKANLLWEDNRYYVKISKEVQSLKPRKTSLDYACEYCWGSHDLYRQLLIVNMFNTAGMLQPEAHYKAEIVKLMNNEDELIASVKIYGYMHLVSIPKEQRDLITKHMKAQNEETAKAKLPPKYYLPIRITKIPPYYFAIKDLPTILSNEPLCEATVIDIPLKVLKTYPD